MGAYASDRLALPELGRRFDDVLGNREIRNANFFKEDDWAYRYIEPAEGINISDGLPEFVLDELKTKAARQDAGSLNGNQWSSILRNSLAHGGIAYLGNDGTIAREVPVSSFVFVSAKVDRRKTSEPPVVVGLHNLKIEMKNFRNFLVEWVKWLDT